MSLLNKDSIFDSISQHYSYVTAPESIRPIYDRCLVRDIPDAEFQGSIVIPESARNNDSGLRLGIVVAVGNGDRWLEKGFRPGASEPRRAAVVVCECGHHEKMHDRYGCGLITGEAEDTVVCECATFNPRLPMEVEPGDKICYDRRRECELFIDGERYSLIHQEQSIFAVLE